MSMRPVRTRWFEMLTAREDLTVALEALARTGKVELETRSETHSQLNLSDLQGQLEDYYRLARRYQRYWPPTDLRTPTLPGRPSDILTSAMQHLQDWEHRAAPLVQQIEALTSEQSELKLLQSMLAQPDGGGLDFALLAHAGPVLEARLFIIPPGTRVEKIAGTLLVKWTSSGSEEFLLAVGMPADIESLAVDVSALKGRSVHLPAALQGDRTRALEYAHSRLAKLDAQIQGLHQAIDDLAVPCKLPAALGDISRLEWFLTHVSSLPVTENFAWVSGWTSDLEGRQLRAELARTDIQAIVEFPETPRGMQPPMVLNNPWWAQPFELFARMLGMPEVNEADPSRLLAVLAPLLFGYMFGDVGHGLVLFIIGLLLQKRWPVVRLLIANGLAAIAFGFVFGSVFGREDLIPALWVHPIEDPLPVLLVPLGGGVLVLLLGLLLNAVESWWRGDIRRWVQIEAAIVVLYLSLLAGLLLPHTAFVSLVALLWYFTGSLLHSRGKVWSSLVKALGNLVESVFQLLVNTISFVRVGAFALAHGGLSLAFLTLAAATESAMASFLIMLIGNLVVIMLEGLVVTIQTTRLILFEFFIRFLKCTGRMFRPLAAPAALPDIRREM